MNKITSTIYRCPKHTTYSIAVKYADIDKNIVPVVLWLNTYQYTHTLFSCEGTKEQEAYVLFTCSNICDLYDINSIINEFIEQSYKNTYIRRGNITITSEVYQRMLRFNMQFTDTKIRRKFCQYLLENCIDIKE